MTEQSQMNDELRQKLLNYDAGEILLVSNGSGAIPVIKEFHDALIAKSKYCNMLEEGEIRIIAADTNVKSFRDIVNPGSKTEYRITPFLFGDGKGAGCDPEAAALFYKEAEQNYLRVVNPDKKKRLVMRIQTVGKGTGTGLVMPGRETFLRLGSEKLSIFFDIVIWPASTAGESGRAQSNRADAVEDKLLQSGLRFFKPDNNWLYRPANRGLSVAESLPAGNRELVAGLMDCLEFAEECVDPDPNDWANAVLRGNGCVNVVKLRMGKDGVPGMLRDFQANMLFDFLPSISAGIFQFRGPWLTGEVNQFRSNMESFFPNDEFDLISGHNPGEGQEKSVTVVLAERSGYRSAWKEEQRERINKQQPPDMASKHAWRKLSVRELEDNPLSEKFFAAATDSNIPEVSAATIQEAPEAAAGLVPAPPPVPPAPVFESNPKPAIVEPVAVVEESKPQKPDYSPTAANYYQYVFAGALSEQQVSLVSFVRFVRKKPLPFTSAILSSPNGLTTSFTIPIRRLHYMLANGINPATGVRAPESENIPLKPESDFMYAPKAPEIEVCLGDLGTKNWCEDASHQWKDDLFDIYMAGIEKGLVSPFRTFKMKSHSGQEEVVISSETTLSEFLEYARRMWKPGREKDLERCHRAMLFFGPERCEKIWKASSSQPDSAASVSSAAPSGSVVSRVVAQVPKWVKRDNGASHNGRPSFIDTLFSPPSTKR